MRDTTAKIRFFIPCLLFVICIRYLQLQWTFLAIGPPFESFDSNTYNASTLFKYFSLQTVIVCTAHFSRGPSKLHVFCTKVIKIYVFFLLSEPVREKKHLEVATDKKYLEKNMPKILSASLDMAAIVEFVINNLINILGFVK